ncbi:hypothetical protein ACHJH3_06185 [Campylobacter sp. MOP7]|uniref:hypothetical protein n=1 Tax=Campylobacter canis TaxID=3378588 RepID=UPI00387E5F5A
MFKEFLFNLLNLVKEISIMFGIGAFFGSCVALGIAYYYHKDSKNKKWWTKQPDFIEKSNQIKEVYAKEQLKFDDNGIAISDNKEEILSKEFIVDTEAENKPGYHIPNQSIGGYWKRGIIELLQDIEPKRGKSLTGSQQLSNAIRRQLRTKLITRWQS